MRERIKRLHAVEPRAVFFIHHEVADVVGRRWWQVVEFGNERLVFIGRHIAIQSFKDHVPILGIGATHAN